MDTDSFLHNTKTKDIQVDIAKNVETRFDTSIMNYLLSKAKNKLLD